MTRKPIRKLLVANRGEIALRVMRTCHEMGIEPVAVYSDADRNALHVRAADQAVRLGPAPASESYLRADRILDAARQTGAQAIHPGYGFLSENAGFGRAVRDAGLIFVGPPPEAIEAMGDKIEARRRMLAADVPVVPGTAEPMTDPEALAAQAAAIGYPVLIKASAGGGGKGIRLVHDGVELKAAAERAASEAQSAFGDGSVYLEKALIGARHIEVQLFADAHGHAVHLGERDCSIQRRHQKVVEERPSPFVDEELRQAMGAAAVKAALAIGYQNAGTVEFLVDGQRNFYLLEMNTRLQVEHPVTEMTCGLDLVAWQLKLAMGEPLPLAQEDIRHEGHAIEARVYAEDADHGFLPAMGTVRRLELPGGPGVRVDTGLFEGMEVGPHYDPMLAKLVVHGAERDHALARMRRALSEFTITGVTTNLPFLRRVLDGEAFTSGNYHTRTVEDEPAAFTPRWSSERAREVALLAASLAWVLRRRRAVAGGGRLAGRSRWVDDFRPGARA